MDLLSLSSLDKIPFCKVFYPTESDFSDFSKYMEYCDKNCKTGIFKVIPPKSFCARKDKYSNFEFRIPNPIEQNVSGSNGVYSLTLFTQSSRTYEKYRKLCAKAEQAISNLSQIEIESLFWRTIKYSSPLYGSDSPGSLMDRKCSWNLNEIITPLKNGLNYQEMNGITTPYLYFGCWKSMFCFHKEDMDLNSINYMHFGKPKHWYGIPVEQQEHFREIMIKLFPEASKKCTEFLRHKTFIVHPILLINHGIKVYKCIQEPGEFIITQGGSYHGGFNYGLNCAEAVNFCTSSWITLGQTAKACKCQSGTVEFKMDEFLLNMSKNAAKEDTNEKSVKHIQKKMIGLPTKKLIEPQSEHELEKWVQCDNIHCKKWRKFSGIA